MNDTTLDQFPILKTVRESGCPELSWLAKPGESVRYYKRVPSWAGATWDQQWEEITAAEAYEIAGRHDRGASIGR